MSLTTTKPIVVPFDFSEHAVEAVHTALKIAELPGLVHVLHVLPFMIPTEPGAIWGTVDDESRTQHALEAMKRDLPPSKYGQLCMEVHLGDPGSVTTQRADELNCELIVVGSHGRTGLARLVLGSVAERVTRLSHCPVLVVKLPAEAETSKRLATEA